jgi:hypothetical protein
MKIIIGAGLIAVAIAGCGSGSGSGSAPAKAAPVPSISVAACKKLYIDWMNGASRSATKRFVATQQDLAAAGDNPKDLRAIASAAQAEGQAAAVLAGYPPPACADPHGDLARLLADAEDAGTNAGAATDLSALVAALAPLKQAPALEAGFTAEVKRATGL